MLSESQTRQQINDINLQQAGWLVHDQTQVILEMSVKPVAEFGKTFVLAEAHAPPCNANEFCDNVLLGKNGQPLAVVEAKMSTNHAEIGREEANL